MLITLYLSTGLLTAYSHAAKRSITLEHVILLFCMPFTKEKKGDDAFEPSYIKQSKNN